MDDVGLDPVTGQPSGQPEPVTPSLKGNSDACNGAPAPACLVTPAMQHAQQFRFVWCDLLQWLSLYTWDGPGDQPTRLAELDDSNQGGVLLEWGEGPAQIVLLGHLPHSTGVDDGTMVPVPHRLPHSF
jgi:hypothetical protein